MSAGGTGGGVVAGKAWIVVGANIKPLIMWIRKGQAQLRGAQAAVAKVGASFAKMGALIALPMGIAVKTFANFEDQMLSVAAKTGAVGAEFQSLTDMAKELGASTSFTARQVAEGMDFMAMAGFDAKQIIAGIPAVLDLARAGMLDLGRASDIVTDIGSAFKFTAGEIGLVADVIAATATSANTSVEQMGEAMKFVAPVARAAGQSIQETSAAIGLLGNVGLKGSVAGTGLAIVMRKLSEEATQNKLGEYVEVVDEVTGEFRPLLDIMRDFGKATEKLPGPEKLRLFNELFSARGSKIALNLAAAGDEIDRMRKVTNNAGGAAKRMADIMEKGLGGAARRAMSAFEGLQIAIGEALMPTVKAMLSTITQWLQGAIAWVEANKELVVWIGKVGVALLLTGGSLLVFSKGLGLAASAIGMLIGGGSFLAWIGGINIAMQALATKGIGSLILSLKGLSGQMLWNIKIMGLLKIAQIEMAAATAFAAGGGGIIGGAKAFGAALTALLGPAGLVVIALAAIAYSVYTLWNAFEDNAAAKKVMKDIQKLNDLMEVHQVTIDRLNKEKGLGMNFTADAAKKEVEERIVAWKKAGATNEEIDKKLMASAKALSKWKTLIWTKENALSKKNFEAQKNEQIKIHDATLKAFWDNTAEKIDMDKKSADSGIKESKRERDARMKVLQEIADQRKSLFDQLDSIEKGRAEAKEERTFAETLGVAPEAALDYAEQKLEEAKQRAQQKLDEAQKAIGAIVLGDEGATKALAESASEAAVEAENQVERFLDFVRRAKEQLVADNQEGDLIPVPTEADVRKWSILESKIEEIKKALKLGAEDFQKVALGAELKQLEALQKEITGSDIISEQLSGTRKGIAGAEIVGQFGAAGFAEKFGALTGSKTEDKILTEAEKQTKELKIIAEKVGTGGYANG